MIEFLLSGRRVKTDAPPDMPLLWLLRDHFDLKGIKYGCGIGLCGACNVLLARQAAPSCTLPVERALCTSVITIEGPAGEKNQPVIQAGSRKPYLNAVIANPVGSSQPPHSP